MLRNDPTHFIEAMDVKNEPFTKNETLNDRAYCTGKGPINLIEQSLALSESLYYYKTIGVFYIFPTTTPLADRLKKYSSC